MTVPLIYTTGESGSNLHGKMHLQSKITPVHTGSSQTESCFVLGAGIWDHRFAVNKKMCQEKCSQLRSFSTIKTFTLAHHDGDAELADTPGFKGGRGAAVKELTLQSGLFIGTDWCPPPAQQPAESNSFCSSP